MYIALLKKHYETELAKAEVQIDYALQNPGTSSFETVKNNFDSLVQCRQALDMLESIVSKAKKDSPEETKKK
jgi:hypothetical protein